MRSCTNGLHSRLVDTGGSLRESSPFRSLVARDRTREGQLFSFPVPRARVFFRASYHDIPQIVGFHAGCREDPTLDSQPVGLGPRSAPTP